MPRVSVNICCYNGGKYIAETISSVLAQTFTDFELVIVNDGSKDDTEGKILGFNDGRIKYVFQENRGLSATRNRALDLSKGEFIAILDQDDLWEPEKLELQLRVMDKNPGTGVVYSDALIIDENGVVKGAGKRNRYCRGKIISSLLKGNYIYCPTAMFRTTALKVAGKFRTDLRISEEYEMYLRLARTCDFDFVDKPLARYRVHSENSSRDAVKDYTETIVCLVDFAAGEQDIELRNSAVSRADITRLKLAALLIWSARSAEAGNVLLEIGPGVAVGFLGLLLRFISALPSGLSKLMLTPLKYAGMIK